jgi:hypothetical protein
MTTELENNDYSKESSIIGSHEWYTYDSVSFYQFSAGMLAIESQYNLKLFETGFLMLGMENGENW